MVLVVLERGMQGTNTPHPHPPSVRASNNHSPLRVATHDGWRQADARCSSRGVIPENLLRYAYPKTGWLFPSVLKLRGHTEADDARIAAAQDARIAKQEGASEACFTSIKPFDHHQEKVERGGATDECLPGADAYVRVV